MKHRKMKFMQRNLFSICCFTLVIFCGFNVCAASDKQIIYVTSKEWCGPCQPQDALVDSLTKENTRGWDIKTYQYEDPELKNFDLNIVAIPVMFFLHKGELVGYRSGNLKEEEFYHILEQLEVENR